LKNLNAELPYHSSGVYYGDEIGNISTSHASRDHKNKIVKLEITPRFAIFGGWKSNWYLGWNLPVHHYLYTDEKNPEQYVLR
jgi:oligosaccharyltransferase complex subunit alpha (ribophorin I)